MKLDNKAIGVRIRKEREKLGLSREKLAELLGLSNYYIGQLERGERQMSMPTLVAISKCLHVSLDYLVCGKITCTESLISEQNAKYLADCDKLQEAGELLQKCSSKELELLIKLMKIILPYIKE